MNKRIGASSSREPVMKGLRSTPSRDNERSRQRDLSKNPWSSEGQKNASQNRATNIENILRYAFLRKGINFIEQASIGPWSIDFLLPDYMACVEADGEFWHSSVSAKMKDRRKDAWLKSKGYAVFHFDGKDLIENSDYCVETMLKSLNLRIDKMSENILSEINNIEQEREKEDYEQWISGSS